MRGVGPFGRNAEQTPVEKRFWDAATSSAQTRLSHSFSSTRLHH